MVTKGMSCDESPYIYVRLSAQRKIVATLRAMGLEMVPYNDHLAAQRAAIIYPSVARAAVRRDRRRVNSKRLNKTASGQRQVSKLSHGRSFNEAASSVLWIGCRHF